MHERSQTLRIGFDGRPLVEGELRGFSRYTFELIRSLRDNFGSSAHILCFSPEPIHPVFQDVLGLEQVIFKSPREVFWEQYELPRQLRKHGIDVFHVTANRGLPWRKVCGYVLTIHDIIEVMPQFVPRGPLKSYLRRRYADVLSVRSADEVITVSEHSKRDICGHWRLPDGRVHVIHEAADDIFSRTECVECCRRARQKYNLPDKYLLYVGGFDRKKNIPALVDAYGRLGATAPALVLAGGQKWQFSEVLARVESMGLGDRVLMPGHIDDFNLPALYQGALAFVYPSLYEGFGLQLLEAMASGTPVLAANRTSFPEVVGNAGLLFDPDNPGEIARALERIITDEGLRSRLRQAGRERAGLFSWWRTAEQTLTIYRSAASKFETN